MIMHSLEQSVDQKTTLSDVFLVTCSRETGFAYINLHPMHSAGN